MNCAEHPGNETVALPGEDVHEALHDGTLHDAAPEAVIARAEGALMAAHGCTAQVAAGILTGVARSARTELRTVAETVAAVAGSNSQSPPEALRAAITCALRDVLP